MKPKLLFLFLSISSTYLSAQTVSIPDEDFEQYLVDYEIDSDGVVNGQILTADAENITSLYVEGYYYPVSDLTGIEAFINLEELIIINTQITNLDMSQLTQLRILNCGMNILSSIDVSANPLLEELYIGNDWDLGENGISVVDLSNNPNIQTFSAVDNHSALEEVHLTNGNNNQNMNIYIGRAGDYPEAPLYNTCFFVDDTEAAQNNEFPYSEWQITYYNVTYSFVDECTMSSKTPETLFFSIYPNPVKDILQIDAANQPIDKLIMYDHLGRKVMEEAGAEELSVSHLAPGSYILKIVSGKRVQTKKVLVE